MFPGSVRAESFTRPKSYYQSGIINEAQESKQETYGTECTPDPTMGEVLQEETNGINLNNQDEAELLEKLADRHYYR